MPIAVGVRVGRWSRGLAPAAALVLTLAACSHHPPAAAPAPGGAAAAGAEPAGPAYEWILPPGFPEPPAPPGNPMTAAKVELGRYLFYERRLSGSGAYACASCHQQRLAFTDGRARALGATGELHRRGAMSLVNVAYSPAMDWVAALRPPDHPDFHHGLLEAQMLRPLLGTTPIEMGAAGREEEILARLAADPLYAGLFAAAFPGEAAPVTLDNVRRAIASFERTLISAGSPYDRLLFEDDRQALSEPARRGMRLFFSEEIGCAGCHGGLNLSGSMAVAGAPPPPVEHHNTALYNLDGAGGYPPADTGLAELTGDPADMGRFRAPTLRNIALTAPYMHDGSLPTLAAVIDHYAAGGRNLGADGRPAKAPSPLRSPGVAGFAIDDQRRGDLVAFLESLTDDGLTSEARFADPFPPSGRAVRPPRP